MKTEPHYTCNKFHYILNENFYWPRIVIFSNIAKIGSEALKQIPSEFSAELVKWFQRRCLRPIKDKHDKSSLDFHSGELIMQGNFLIVCNKIQ